MIKVNYRGTRVQIVNVYMSTKGTSKEYRLLLQWLHAHVAPDSRLVLVGGDCHCNAEWSADCVSAHTKVAVVLLEFVANKHLQPFVHGMQGPTLVRAQGFVGALDFFLSRTMSLDVGAACVERDCFPACLITILCGYNSSVCLPYPPRAIP